MGINYPRKLIHISFGFFLYILSLILKFFYFKLILFFFFLCMSIFDFFRMFFYEKLPLKDFWLPLFKKEEFFGFCDAWFYLLGLIFSSCVLSLFKFRLILLILTLADPLAAFAGFYIGRYKIFRNKTLEGSIVFFLSALAITYFYIKTINLYYAILCLILSITELVSRRDNFWISFVGSIYLRILPV